MSYASFLVFPRTDTFDDDGASGPNPLRPFANYGMNLGLHWHITRDLSMISRFQLLFSREEEGSGHVSAGDVVTTRGFLGAGLNLVRIGDFSASFALLLDLTRLSDFLITPTCGVSGYPKDTCTQTPVAYQDNGVLFGLNASPQITYKIYRSLHVSLSTNISYFFVSSSEDLSADMINFPLSSELGVKYRF